MEFLPSQGDGQPALEIWFNSLDRGLLHPTPTNHFKVRLILLLTFTTIYIALAAAYGIVSVRLTEERPRRRAIWFARMVSRPSGRFIVLNPRLVWSIGGCVTGLWSIALILYNWQAFINEGDQSAMWGFRAMNTFVFFVVSWSTCWAGCQAFLLTADSDKTKLPGARKANLLFLVGGAVLASCSFALALYQSIEGQLYWREGGALRQQLLDYINSTPSRIPSPAQMEVLVPLAEQTARAWRGLQRATVIHATFSPILPISCLIVNAGGLALVIKLRRQIRESMSDLAHSHVGRFTSDDPADWRGPSPAVSSPMGKLDSEGSNEKFCSNIPPAISPPSTLDTMRSDVHRMTTLRNLKRAQVDMTALAVFFVASVLTFTASFILSDLVMITSAGKVWSFAEGAFGASLWQTTLCGPFLWGFLLYNATSDRLSTPTDSSLLASLDSVPVLPPFPDSSRCLDKTRPRQTFSPPVLRRADSTTPMMSEFEEDHKGKRRGIPVAVTVEVETKLEAR